MLLENLYRVLYENQEVSLQDTREQKKKHYGTV